jgi:hypothetical protein
MKMKKILFVFVLIGLSIPLWSAFAQAYECDTLHVEVYPPDTLFSGSVRVPLYVSHHRVCGELPQLPCDSLNLFVIPLCYTHTNPGKYCSLSYDWNNTSLYPFPDSFLYRSIFRHFISPEDDTLVHNWMMDQSQVWMAWDLRTLDVDDTSHFWLGMAAVGQYDQYFWEASRVLLATMTFRVEDTMTICLDSCFWPPYSHLQFVASCSLGYDLVFVPETNLPYCFSVSYPARGDVNANGVIDVGDVVFLIKRGS